MVMSEGVPESTPSRLGLLNAVIEVLKLADGDVAPSGGAGCRRRTQDLADLVEREAHLAQQQDRPNECDRSFVISALPRPSIVGLQDVEALVVAQSRTRHPRTLRQLSNRQQLTVDHLDFKGTWAHCLAEGAGHSASSTRAVPSARHLPDFFN
jgi:hypothetical protein